MIDCTFVFLIFVITQTFVFRPIRELFDITENWFHSGFNTELYTIATISIPVWLYFSILDSSLGKATIGKQLLGIFVADSDSKLQIRFPRSMLRSVLKLLPWELAHLGNNLPEPIWFAEQPGFRIGFIFSGLLMSVAGCINQRRQSIHDMLVGTVVLNTDNR